MVTLKRKGHQGFFEKYKLFEYNNRGNYIYLSIYRTVRGYFTSGKGKWTAFI